MGYQRILSVVNEQTGSTVAARYAIALAAAGGSELVLYAAHGEGTGGSTLLHTERHLDHLFRIAFERGIPVTRITESGMIARLLPRRVEEERVNLVFYPLIPPECYGAAFQQQAVHQLLRLVRADLAIMRIMHMGKLHPHHILVPLGGRTGDRERLADFISLLAKSFHSPVTLFHRPGGRGPSRLENVALLRDNLLRQQVQILERSATGRIARAIALEAVSHHHDLIVLGASERGTLRRLFFGNPAGDVMQHPPCNAILFRQAPDRP
jgi:nucleotide-binding universal stress UspA family protein